ncbi:hypothetical protein ABI59_10325 [Acidobacteria bacterium Mor1]|nr:hypothetical protein ABI59_10325 [Acidobacteria bacterium Mor1]
MALVLHAAVLHAAAGSLSFGENPPSSYEYGLHTTLPATFGQGEFTFELWVQLDPAFPVGPCIPDTPGQRSNWCDEDEIPYGGSSWWFSGNFLLDGHNNGSCFCDGTFSLQFYGGGRLRWLFGDGDDPGPGDVWSVGAFPASSTPGLRDGDWHQITLVRRFVGVSESRLELWIDGSLIDDETSGVRTDMRTYWDSWPGFPAGQEGWFWGAEKQAAIGVLTQYEDHKGLLDELRFWSRAKSAAEIAADYDLEVTGSELGLVAWFPFDENGGSQTCDRLDPGFCMTLIDNPMLGLWSVAEAPLRAASGVGQVPGRASQGVPLTLAKTGPGVVTLDWGGSCSADADDFAVYRGQLGVPGDYSSETCSTGGATSWDVPLATAGGEFFIVVPRDGTREGSYGSDSGGNRRSPSSTPCVAEFAPGGC